ncbi:YjcQ family protein [Lapidilactobacillus luobeiensis]|uniref:YjcQ family protein n=1 Tax=Lapidilactobacillus luobeiensis TaxID=2950371 RepID=UPI0021C298A2|nr:YjcQ family protein [Lapidilactobacillus luobeiensis]
MAKDDFFYIAYKILAYVYECMKKGESVDPSVIDPTTYRITYPYLISILEELTDEGYLKGIKFIPTKDEKIPIGLDKMKISIKGIEYLQENTMMKKALKTIKEVKDSIPGI